MPRVQRSPRAHADLLAIWAHIGQHDPAAADRALDLIEEKCRLLADMPGMGRPRPEFDPELRSFAVGKFVVFYRPLADGIEIARVVHGARDLDRIF